jgi:hypothetical protein
VVTTTAAHPAHRAGDPAGVRGSSQTASAMIATTITAASGAAARRRRGAGARRRGGGAGMSVGAPQRKQTIALSAIAVPQDRHFIAAPLRNRHSLLKNHPRVVS